MGSRTPEKLKTRSKRKNVHKLLRAMKTQIVFLLFALLVIVNGAALRKEKAADNAGQEDVMASDPRKHKIGQEDVMASDPRKHHHGQEDVMASDPRRRRHKGQEDEMDSEEDEMDSEEDEMDSEEDEMEEDEMDSE